MLISARAICLLVVIAMSKIEEKSIRVINFSGNDEDWEYWSVKFEARADLRGFGELLTGDKNFLTKSEFTTAKAADPQTPTTEEIINLYEQGKKGFKELL